MRLLIICIAAFAMFSCNPQAEKSDLKTLRSEVMDVHDEVMPKMGELRKTEKALRQMASETQDSVQTDELLSAADGIKSANENMMQWMRNYDPSFSGTEEEILAYLKDQKEKIEVVRSDMLTSLEAGQKLLEE